MSNTNYWYELAQLAAAKCIASGEAAEEQQKFLTLSEHINQNTQELIEMVFTERIKELRAQEQK